MQLQESQSETIMFADPHLERDRSSTTLQQSSNTSSVKYFHTVSRHVSTVCKLFQRQDVQWSPHETTMVRGFRGQCKSFQTPYSSGRQHSDFVSKTHNSFILQRPYSLWWSSVHLVLGNTGTWICGGKMFRVACSGSYRWTINEVMPAPRRRRRYL